MTRAMTTAEKTLMRTEGQRSDLHLLTIMPEEVYTARINQTFTSVDSVIQLTYDNGLGTLANVLPGMTMYIGSTAGAYDKGMVRIRKSPSATTIYIGTTSDIDFADNDYLTVVNEFNIWPKEPVSNGSVTYIDSDIVYTSQHLYFAPVVRMGPMVEVLELTGETVTSHRVAETVTILGAEVSAWDWSAPGAFATANLNTATPTITYDIPGLYRQSCIFTAGGLTFTEYRWCYVVDPDNQPTGKFMLERRRSVPA